MTNLNFLCIQLRLCPACIYEKDERVLTGVFWTKTFISFRCVRFHERNCILLSTAAASYHIQVASNFFHQIYALNDCSVLHCLVHFSSSSFLFYSLFSFLLLSSPFLFSLYVALGKFNFVHFSSVRREVAALLTPLMAIIYISALDNGSPFERHSKTWSSYSNLLDSNVST